MEGPLCRQWAEKKENDSFGWRRQMCLLIVQPVFFLRSLTQSLELCLARHHHLSLLWGMAQGNIYDALCTKWVQPFKSPKQLNSSSSHFSCEQRLRRDDRTGGARVATGPGQYLWCFMHQMGSTVQITRATEQQQQSLLLLTAPRLVQINMYGNLFPRKYIWKMNPFWLRQAWSW